MKDIIKQFLEDTFLFEFNEDVTEKDDLIKLGLIDSIGYIELVSFLKNQFNISFTEDDMMNNVLVSVDSMVEFIEVSENAV